MTHVHDEAHIDRLAYSPAQAAKVLGISRAKLYELLGDGSIRSVKIGSRRLVRRIDLEAYLDRLAAANDAPTPTYLSTAAYRMTAARRGGDAA